MRRLTVSLQQTLATAALTATVALSVAAPTRAQSTAPGIEASAGPATTADDLDPETRVLAREFAMRGAEAYDAGDYAAALAHFDRASAILDAPSIAVMQARTLVKLGRWLEGLDKFQQTARLHLMPSAPAPYREAVAQAAQEAEALRRQIPQVALMVSSELTQAQPPIEITFDGKSVPSALRNIGRPVNPGRHVVRATTGGTQFYESTLDVEPSQQLQVQLPPPPRQAPAPTPAPASSPPPPAETVPTPVEEPRRPSAATNWPLYGALGVTGLGLIGTVTATLLGNQHKQTLDAGCDPKTKICPPALADEVRALHTDRTIFFICAGVTALAGSASAYLWLTESDDADRVGLRLSPGALSVVGRY